MMMWLILLSFALISLYLFAKLTSGIVKSSTCLIGKTAIITGAASGLGYKTALNLASRGCRIIMADVVDMEESKRNIIKYTNNTNITTEKLDLSSFKSVRDFAAEINKKVEKVDILINNAGIGATVTNRTEDGLHPVIQINYFGHFLLTHLLIDLLKKSAPSRIIFTSSLLAFANNLCEDNLNFDDSKTNLPEFFRHLFAYGNSKLAMIVASDIFADKLKGTGVTSNCIHPGLVRTPIFTNLYATATSSWYKPVIGLINLIYGKDPWEGSQCIVNTAVSKKLEKESGKFFSDCKSFVKPLSVYNKDFCQKIWKLSENYVGLKENEKM